MTAQITLDDVYFRFDLGERTLFFPKKHNFGNDQSVVFGDKEVLTCDFVEENVVVFGNTVKLKEDKTGRLITVARIDGQIIVPVSHTVIPVEMEKLDEEPPVNDEEPPVNDEEPPVNDEEEEVILLEDNS